MNKPCDAAPAKDAIANEVLSGADALALFIYGDKKFRRKVYYLIERHGLPVFRIGTNICARKAALVAWLESKEAG